ncbi:hypothetical protein HG535_0G01280 [Zygotorulaspora mrakii]|uniref:chitin synthase n=1 Tax=Zygotorulaspora mrakii TaxID=42260 RepID=A0A7H9B7M3_ZYGMR|nr:uncharacterized protein HG535_0G01280 [Zygotorulaspora mrakii]QLG74244.1 hypothetical protein HG535_0G01280 [Zygotorulaspora mrakii]
MEHRDNFHYGNSSANNSNEHENYNLSDIDPISDYMDDAYQDHPHSNNRHQPQSHSGQQPQYHDDGRHNGLYRDHGYTDNTYDNFVNPLPSDPNLQSNTAYNDAFIANAPQSIPSINVVQHTPDVTQNTIFMNARTDVPAPVSGSAPYFNDEEYYYRNQHQAGGSSMGSTSDLDDLGDQSERPILNHQRQDVNAFSYHQDPVTIGNYLHNEQSYDDPEGGYVDQRGDDYQINTYLDRDGEMVDPYQAGPQESDTRYMNYDHQPKQKSYAQNELIREGEDLSNSSIGEYSHRDLGEYDDITTLDRMNYTASGVPASSSSSSLNSRDKDLTKDEMKRVPTRTPTIMRKFKLWRGNFVFDSPVSQSLLKQYSNATSNEISNEFKFMRYQAVTCEPNQLAAKNFTVRQLKYLTPRRTEMMIVITMYNEDHILLGRTLKGVMDNIKCMVRKKNSSTWGPDAWKKIVVCVVSDGRSKISEKSLALMSALGCYQDGFAKDEINGKKVAMHVYEHTTMMNVTNITSDGIELSAGTNTVPVQLLFCLKEQNQKKINSHRWAFEGFAELLQPDIVTLLDAGTMTGKDSIYQLWREFRNPQVGGACGEIKAELGRGFKHLLNPLVASQNFEYKMSNILDKTTESNFGFITVLPGAFSAYRFEAVKGQPLQKYFYGESMEDKGFHIFSSNMYLAEDRILCFELVTKKNSNWILKYCRSSYASTDVPERVPEFILQRRRWLNGSFFAGVYSFFHFHRIWTSGHNVWRKIMLSIEFFYLLLNTIISWFSLSSFFLVFRILTLSIALTYHSAFSILSVIFYWLYGICLISTFILSLGNKPQSTEWFYVATCIFFAVLMIYMIFCSIFMSVRSFENILDAGSITFRGLLMQETFRDMVVSLGSTYCLYWLSSIIYLQPWHMLTSFVQYILLSPSYVNVLNIYAFCNVHDISWGTKGSSAKPLGKINAKEDGTFKMEILVSAEEIQSNYDKHLHILEQSPEENEEKDVPFEEQKAGYYAKIRSLVIIFWVLTNFVVVAVVLEAGGIGDYIAMRPNNQAANPDGTAERAVITTKASIYFTIILWIVAFMALIRFIGCALYMSSRLIKRLTFK